jgi:CHAT domain-containing protein
MLRLLFPDGRLIQEFSALKEVLSSSKFDLLHFACHNTFRSERGGSAITFGDFPFEPTLLNAYIAVPPARPERALVFVNACRSAGQVHQYTQMNGWRQRFLSAGAAAFVGTLWEVRDRTAAEFARQFYAALRDGKNLGEASQTARSSISKEPGDPTWLAYTISGSPLAKLEAV